MFAYLNTAFIYNDAGYLGHAEGDDGDVAEDGVMDCYAGEV